jgi:lysophospholipase L1-like esterase
MVGVTARRRGFRAGVVLAAVVLAMPAPAVASTDRTTTAAQPATRSAAYVALGDSFAAGNGTGRYDLAGAPCRRSSLSAAALWAASHRPRTFTFVACSAATTADVATGQVPKVPPDADLVTITAGGNDAGFGFVLRTCTSVRSDDLCLAAIRLGQAAAVSTAPAGLAAVVTAVRHRAPKARVVVLGYPRLFETGPCTVPGAPNARRRLELNRAADTLSTSLAEAAKAAGARFVDVRGRFAGHGVCAAPGQAWINPPGRGADSYHPNAAGYARGYLPALETLP